MTAETSINANQPPVGILVHVFDTEDVWPCLRIPKKTTLGKLEWHNKSMGANGTNASTNLAGTPSTPGTEINNDPTQINSTSGNANASPRNLGSTAGISIAANNINNINNNAANVGPTSGYQVGASNIIGNASVNNFSDAAGNPTRLSMVSPRNANVNNKNGAKDLSESLFSNSNQFVLQLSASSPFGIQYNEVQDDADTSKYVFFWNISHKSPTDTHNMSQTEPYIAQDPPISYEFFRKVEHVFENFISGTTNLPVDWYKLPYARIFIIPSPTIEDYKVFSATHRLKEFIEICLEKRVEFLIVHAPRPPPAALEYLTPLTMEDIAKQPPPRTPSTSARFFSKSPAPDDDAAVRNYRKVFEKIKLDLVTITKALGSGPSQFLFSTSTSQNNTRTFPEYTLKDRVVFLPVQGKNDQDAVAVFEFVTRLREVVQVAVETRILAYEDELVKLYTNRTVPGWSYFMYFTFKESLSYVYSNLGRKDVARDCYDELGMNANERNVLNSYDGEFGADDFRDALADALLDTTKKDYRKLIYESKITEFDFLSFLFAKQFMFLTSAKQYKEAAERALYFIPQLANRLKFESKREGSKINPLFAEVWVYWASTKLAQVVEVCLKDAAAEDGVLSNPQTRYMAQLMACFHVYSMKAFTSLAETILPGSLKSSDNEDTTHKIHVDDESRKELLESIPDPVLKMALSSTQEAEKLFGQLAFSAATLYEMGGRSRGAATLGGEAGFVRLRNHSLEEAERLLSVQCSRFSLDYGWNDLHWKSRMELAKAEKGLNRVQEYLLSCLAMLIMTRMDSSITACNMEREAARWGKETAEAAAQLPRVMKYRMERLFSTYIKPQQKEWNVDGDVSATLVITSDIPAELTFDKITVQFRLIGEPSKGNDSTYQPNKTIIFYHNGPVKIRSGKNEFELVSLEGPTEGKYATTIISLFINNLKLVYVVLENQPLASKAATDPSISPVVWELMGLDSHRFPIFYAVPRSDYCIINVEKMTKPYLVIPSVTSFLKLSITAGKNGIAQNSVIEFKISNFGDKENGYVAFNLDLEEEEKPLDLLELNLQDRESETYSGVIEYDVKPENVYSFQIGLKVINTVAYYMDESETSGIRAGVVAGQDFSEGRGMLGGGVVAGMSGDQKTIECELLLKVTGNELVSPYLKRMDCRKQNTLRFVTPVRVECSIFPFHGDQSSDNFVISLTISSNDAEEDLVLKSAMLLTPDSLKIGTVTNCCEELLPVTLCKGRGSFSLVFELNDVDVVIGEEDMYDEEDESDKYCGSLELVLEMPSDGMEVRSHRAVDFLDLLIDLKKHVRLTKTTDKEVYVGERCCMNLQLSNTTQMMESDADDWRLDRHRWKYQVLDSIHRWIVFGKNCGYFNEQGHARNEISLIPLVAGYLTLPRVVIIDCLTGETVNVVRTEEGLVNVKSKDSFLTPGSLEVSTRISYISQDNSEFFLPEYMPSNAFFD